MGLSMLEWVFFGLLAGGAVLTSLMVVLPRSGSNPLYGALWLVLSLGFLAGIFVLLLAHLLAVLQILVYAGAIMVLFIFVIMLLNLSQQELDVVPARRSSPWLGILAMLVVGGTVGYASVAASERTVNELGGPMDATQPHFAGFGSVEAIGTSLFTEHLFPFELTGILLLVAIVGAVVLAKRTL
jgi:NADH-quinone oxidoreductase subunit J